MPKIAVDDFGNKKIHPILGGKASIICYEKEPLTWQYRQLKEGTKLYCYRNLNEKDFAIAVRRAEDLYSHIIDNESQINPLIKDLIDEWIYIKEKKQLSGYITLSTVRGIKTSMRSVIQLYLTKEKKLNRISDIKSDTFLDFNEWRISKSWKTIITGKKTIPPSLITVKKDILRLRDWYKNFLIPKGFAKVVPSTISIVITQDQLDNNPPICLKHDWPLIQNYFDKWSKEINNKKSTEYFRHMCRYFILISYNSGTRPKELLGSIEKLLLPNPDGVLTLGEIIRGGLRWCDIEVKSQEPEIPNSTKLDLGYALIYIRNSLKGKSRKISTNTGKYFIRWRRYCDRFREQNGLAEIKDTDFIFFNPFTSRPYSYSQIGRVWSQMRNNLSLLLKGSKSNQLYTLYSLRSSYITNQIHKGKDIYIINQETGCSLEVIRRYYYR